MVDLIDEIRGDLDEPLDATGSTNFWSQSEIARYVNRGLRQVWQLARNDKGSRWFVRSIRSTDDPLSIFGRPYNPACLAPTDGTDELILPPDFGELLSLEPIVTSTDNLTADITFRFAPLNSPVMRNLSRVSTTFTGFAEYFCDVIQRPQGPRLVLRPTFQGGSDGAAQDCRLEYVLKPDNYAVEDTFEGVGFDDLMLDAVLAYAELECRRKADNPAKLKEATETWAERRALVIETIGPLQTVEHEMVQGFLSEEC